MSTIESYNETIKKTKETLKILTMIPQRYMNYEKDYKFIKNTIRVLSNFLELKNISQENIKKVNKILEILNKENIFNCYTIQMEENFCNKELSKYIEDSDNYRIPNLENFMDNGDFLKQYIEYKIEKYNIQKLIETKERQKNIIKSL